MILTKISTEVPVEVKGIRKDYGNMRGLNDISFKIKPGEIFGLLGPNGAGKTTAIRSLCQLCEIDVGSILINNKNINEDSIAAKRMTGIIPQNRNLHPNLNVLENLMFHAMYYGFSKSEAKVKAINMLKQLGLKDRARENISKLSGGMQQKVLIGRALIQEPSFLIMDEPTVGLDPLARKEIWKIINKLKGKYTILMTTQYIEEADDLCDRVAIMDKGKIVATGTPKELKMEMGETVVEFKFNGETGEIQNIVKNKTNGRMIIEKHGKSLRVFLNENDAIDVAQTLSGRGATDIKLHNCTLEDVFIFKTGKGFADIG
ncbi:ABC-2 type transport system ATP-binding protein/lipooligosaccharide transport system ATP-binding protein [Ruminiclostridium sufflavum DSM 19573]|uniref:ABC-2 type transport system ATP-binding protein/lipooligosaccharide transport system ATP-binding protein n=1 Tax=Ruminiclostridium sufflavum DSM 19573 TaxID=1121337 RepID=A0A318XN01_9FIRM|nr:ABC transporter ATP-binding protein [Ruminiclostridium sufflavum]PYG88013.1 ABC-2 type transport system ATP-binding protein/lipooligosaccharide transport system ATP-binding protein [Ruminiclostridium sufflavum DSM 19573]